MSMTGYQNPSIENFEEFVKAFQDLTTEFEEFRKSHYAFKRRMEGALHQLKKELKEKDKIIASLKKRLSKYEDPDESFSQPKKNSENSGIPTSKEDIPSQIKHRTKTLRQPSGKKPGAQEGHVGCTLTKTDTPDETEQNAPHVCDHCGCELGGADIRKEYSTQEVDIIIKKKIREVEHYSALCPNCGQPVAVPGEPRKRGSNAVVYGPNIKRLALSLQTVYCLPYGRIKDLLGALGINLSVGTIENWIKGARETAERFVDEIKRRISDSEVVHFDETGVYCKKRLDWVWIATTPNATLVFREHDRKAECLERQFGDALENMVAVTDRHSSYFKLGFKDNQICLVHLLRNLQYLKDLKGGDPWPNAVARVLLDAMEARKANPGVALSSKIYRDRLDRLLERDLSDVPKPFIALRNGIERRKDYIFTFLENPDVPPDNNTAELGFRIMKLKANASKTFRSEWGADIFLMLHSIIQTYKKLGRTAMDALRDVLNGLDGEAMHSAV